jgi:hypothetical protein
MTMVCVKIQKLLSGYIDGDLDARTRESVGTHLRQCEACNEEFLSMKELIHELGALEGLKAPDGFTEKVRRKIENPSWSARIRSSLFFPAKIKIPLEIAALATTAVLIFFLVNSFQSDGGLSDFLPGNGQNIVATDSGREKKPVQLVIRLGSSDGNKPLSLENVYSVTSGAGRQGNRNGFGWEHMEPLLGEWGPNRDVSYEKDFLSDIHMIISHLTGRVLSKDYKEGTGLLQYITLEIPSENYRPFLRRIESIGSLQTPAPELPGGERGSVRVRIRITE